MKGISIARRIGYLFALTLTWIAIVFISLLSGCAKVESRPPIVFPPSNPDVAAIKSIVTQTKASNTKAGDAAGRAVQIVEKIIVAPGQEAELQKLKLELQTTIEQLKFSQEFLENANAQLVSLTSQVDEMKAWGVKQNQLYVAEYSRAQKSENALVRADKAVWERNKLIIIQWLAIAGLVAWIFKGPIIALARRFVFPV